MKEKILIAIALLLAFFYAVPQTGIPAFPEITASDLASRECSFERDASAYYMINYAKTDFNIFSNGYYNIVTKRRIRIKILNEKGFENASISIPHLGNSHTSKITGIEAFIFTLDNSGNIVKNKVDKDDIFKTNVSKKNNINIVKFTFPGLKPGCILEYRYEHLERNTFDIDPWFFQNKIPVALSYCEINFPSYAQLDYRLIGQLTANENYYKDRAVDSSQKKNYKKTFVMKDIPSFKEEPLMSSVVDNLNRVEFSLNPEPLIVKGSVNPAERKWRYMNNSLNSAMAFGMQYNIPIGGTEKLLDSVKQLQHKKEKINAIYQYVRKQITWDKHQTMYPYDINEVWNNKTGNSAEINVILLNLLRKSGIESYPILLSTRDNGKTDPDFVHMSQFNNLNVMVFDSTDYYILDGSSKNQSCFIPPPDVVNRNVFLSTTTGFKWVNINDTRPLIKDSVYITASMNKDGMVKGEAVTTSFNFSRELKLSGDDDENKSKDNLSANDAAELRIDSSWMINKENELLPLITHAKLHLPLNNTGNFYFLNATLFNSFRKNPFTDSTRSTDIDFMCNQQYTQIVNLALPPEITLETIPKSVTIRMVDTSLVYSRKIAQRGNVLWVENEFTINKNSYAADDYLAVFQFFKKVYALMAEEVVLNKK